MTTPAGWYADTTAGGRLRWWDGSQWTDQYAPSVDQEPVVVDVSTGKDGRHRLVATTQAIAIDGQAFPLDRVDGVTFSAVRQHLNGAYQGTHFSVTLRAGDQKQGFTMSSGHRDERLDEFRAAYGDIVRLLGATVLPRLAADMVRRLHAGETITLGPAGARVELMRDGFRLKKPLAKPVPWSSVTGTDMEGGRVWFMVPKKPGAGPKRHSLVGLEGENIVVLPDLVDLLRS